MHRIARLQLELTYADEARARDLLARGAELHERRLAPLLEQIFDELDDPTQLLRIDRLELDLGLLSGDLDDELPRRLAPALRDALRRALAGRPATAPAARALELLGLFARTGAAPWWVDRDADDPIEGALRRALTDAPRALAELLRGLALDPAALARLARACDDELRRLARALADDLPDPDHRAALRLLAPEPDAARAHRAEPPADMSSRTSLQRPERDAPADRLAPHDDRDAAADRPAPHDARDAAAADRERALLDAAASHAELVDDHTQPAHPTAATADSREPPTAVTATADSREPLDANLSTDPTLPAITDSRGPLDANLPTDPTLPAITADSRGPLDANLSTDPTTVDSPPRADVGPPHHERSHPLDANLSRGPRDPSPPDLTPGSPSDRITRRDAAPIPADANPPLLAASDRAAGRSTLDPTSLRDLPRGPTDERLPSLDLAARPRPLDRPPSPHDLTREPADENLRPDPVDLTHPHRSRPASISEDPRLGLSTAAALPSDPAMDRTSAPSGLSRQPANTSPAHHERLDLSAPSSDLSRLPRAERIDPPSAASRHDPSSDRDLTGPSSSGLLHLSAPPPRRDPAHPANTSLPRDPADASPVLSTAALHAPPDLSTASSDRPGLSHAARLDRSPAAALPEPSNPGPTSDPSLPDRSLTDSNPGPTSDPSLRDLSHQSTNTSPTSDPSLPDRSLTDSNPAPDPSLRDRSHQPTNTSPSSRGHVFSDHRPASERSGRGGAPGRVPNLAPPRPDRSSPDRTGNERPLPAPGRSASDDLPTPDRPQVPNLRPSTPSRPAPAAERARREALARASELHLENGGLVLLWPFYPRLFERLGLLDDARRFRDDRAQIEAVVLLHYLATGGPQPLEFRLGLAKLLCGRPLEAPCDLDAPLSPAAQAEGDHLLAALRDHLPALGDAPADALRAHFLQRPASLDIQGGAWLLRVQRRPHDALLAHLPWAWAWLRLPWMPSPLRVEW